MRASGGSGSSGRAAGRGRSRLRWCASGVALEPLLQLLLILRHLLARLAPGERHEQLPDAVPLEVEVDRDARALAAVDGVDGRLADDADRAVDPVEAHGPRRLVLGDLPREGLLAAAELPRLGRL